MKSNNKAEKDKRFGRVLWSFFTSLKLTISLMILLALVSIIGTVILQNASPDQYLRHYSFSTYNTLKTLGFLDMYHSWWFVLLIILLCINLLACSIKNFPRIWKSMTRSNPILDDEQVKTLPYVATIKKDLSLDEVRGKIIRIIKKHFGSPQETIVNGDCNLFAEKSKYFRLGIYITHASVIIILIGGLIGSFFGFEGNVNIIEGHSADRIVLQNSLSVMELGFEVRCDDLFKRHTAEVSLQCQSCKFGMVP